MTWVMRDPRRRALKLHEWPEGDRLAWEAAWSLPVSVFDTSNRTAEFSPFTKIGHERGYGRLLGILDRTGRLERDAEPSAHWSEANLQLIVNELLNVGCSHNTIVTYFRHLATVMSLIAPEFDTSIITKPRGVLLTRRFVLTPRQKHLVPSGMLLQLALDLFQNGLASQSDILRRRMVRNAAIVGMLATRAARCRSLTEMELGVNLFEVDDRYRVVYLPENMKMKNELEYFLPLEIAPILRRYLAVERVELLDGRIDRSIWISCRGHRLGSAGVYKLFWKATKQYLGIRLSPHDCRHCLTTSAVYDSPEAAFEVPLTLGHSAATSLKHYNRANGIVATERHGARVMTRTEKLRRLAEQEYGWK